MISGIESGMIPCSLLCILCLFFCICGAGCLDTVGSQEAVPPTPGDPVSLPYFQVAEKDAEETLRQIIEEEIAENPNLSGYAVTAFYNGTSLDVADCTSYHREDGTPPIYVYTFRHTIPSLKDPQHMQDDVTLRITVVEGAVTEQVISIGGNVTVGSV